MNTFRSWYRKNIKWPIQRVRKGYDDTLHWSMDYYLLPIFVGGLRDLIKYNHGAPVLPELYPEHKDPIALFNDPNDLPADLFTIWQDKLTEIADGLDIWIDIEIRHKWPIIDGKECIIFEDLPKEQQDKYEQAREDFFKYFHAFWD